MEIRSKRLEPGEVGAEAGVTLWHRLAGAIILLILCVSCPSDGLARENMSMNDPEARQQIILGKPPRIAPLRPEELDEGAQAIVARIRTAAGGPVTDEVPEIVATLLKHPGLYEKHVALGTELLGNGALSARQRELAILRTGWLCGAPYEWGEHVAIAKRAGLTTDEIERVSQGSGVTGWSAQDWAVLRAAEELHAASMISDAT